jgi:diacylglycerol kinase
MKKFFKSFKYAFNGIAEAVKSEQNMRFHVVSAVLVVIASFLLRLSTIEWIAIIGSIAIVSAFEMLNTALERLTDLVSPEYHPLAGQAKDLASGAVLVAAVGAGIVGCIIFGPKIYALLPF